MAVGEHDLARQGGAMRPVRSPRMSTLALALFAACNLPDDPPLTRARSPKDVLSEDEDGFTAAEVALLHQLSPLPAVPPDPTNAYADNVAAAVLGQRLFFDRAFSGPLVVADDGTNGGLGRIGEIGKVACA